MTYSVSLLSLFFLKLEIFLNSGSKYCDFFLKISKFCYISGPATPLYSIKCSHSSGNQIPSLIAHAAGVRAAE